MNKSVLRIIDVPTITPMDDFTIRSSGLPRDARVAGFHGSERISHCYALDVYVTTLGEDVDVEQSVGARATLSIEVAGEPPSRILGVIAELEHLRAVSASEVSGSTSSLYRAQIVPSLWFLGLTRHSRVFTKKTILQIVSEVLEAEGIPSTEYEVRVARDYPVEEHVCQYKESSLAFISRWLEREGLVYFFEHEGERERLVITDDKSLFEPSPRLTGAVHYHPSTPGDATASRCFDDVTVKKTSTAAKVRLDEYDYAKPNLDLAADFAVSLGLIGEISQYGNRSFSPEHTRRLAAIRSEELRANALSFVMLGTEPRVRAGHCFELDRHPMPSHNVEYLAVAVERFGYSASLAGGWGDLVQPRYDDVYRVRVASLPRSIPYRAPSATAWPRIDGYENGVVDGDKDSEYAQIDEQGRYLVRFKFDEGSARDGKSSTWVRMMQPHGGGAEGFHFPLRKGTEVLCSFLGGDPDRPVIIGVVPNVLKPSPVTQGNHTQNILQTGGETYMCIDDQKGAKYASLLCPYTPGMEAELYLGHGRPNGAAALTVPAGPQRKQVGEFATPIEAPNFHLRTNGTGMVSSDGALDVGAGGPLQLESDTSLLVYSPMMMLHTDGPQEVHVAGDQVEHVEGSWQHHVGGDVRQTFDSALMQRIEGSVSEDYNSAVMQDFQGPHLLRVATESDQTFTTGLKVAVASGGETHNVKPSYQLNAEVDIGLTALQVVRVFGNDEIDLHSPKKIELSTGAGARIVLEGDTIRIEATNLFLQGSDSVQIFGANKVRTWGKAVDVIAGSGDLTLLGGPMVKINT
jgi:type VI secretion system secreted protein VgrG